VLVFYGDSGGLSAFSHTALLALTPPHRIVIIDIPRQYRVEYAKSCLR
jgi:hypothetical protein